VSGTGWRNDFIEQIIMECLLSVRFIRISARFEKTELSGATPEYGIVFQPGKRKTILPEKSLRS
jgi:hypothetical protein